MKVTVLVDNNDGNGLIGEWGLSFYIEHEGTTVLLDAGLSSLFANNADKLGLDLEKVDYAVLSHAHNDHANGMDTFLMRNNHADLYVAWGCGECCYDRKGLLYKYAGIPRGLLTRNEGRVIYADRDMMIDKGIRLLAHTTPDLDKVGLAEKMYLRTGRFRFIPDDFRHEQSLVFELPEGIVIFNSCSHAGADNIVREVLQVYPGQQILAMIGGFHLYNKSDEYVREFAHRLENTGVRDIYTGHCTGDRALDILAEELGGKVHPFRTGLVFEI